MDRQQVSEFIEEIGFMWITENPSKIKYLGSKFFQ